MIKKVAPNVRTLKIGFALLTLSCAPPLICQDLLSSADLPEAPSAVLQSTSAAQTSPNLAGTGQVDGVVQDTQQNAVPGANVTLTAPGKLGERTTTAGSDGSFSFSSLPPGEYRLIVSAPGLLTFRSREFGVRPGATITAPAISMVVSTSTTVDVTASPDQVAVAQVQEQEKQRVFGVFQNFYTSYIWDAAPMPPKEKYKLAFRTLLDPTSFLLVAGVASAEQYNGTYPDYGPGIQGYGKRFGAALADSTTGRIVGSAILPVVFHQDPRYFYQGSGGIPSRTWHAISSSIITRADSGKLQPNYSHVLGNLVAGAVANAYHPAASRGVGLTFETLGITVGANAAGNLFREFVLRGLVPAVPSYANGKDKTP